MDKLVKHLLLAATIALLAISLPAVAALTESSSALNYAADQSVPPVAHHALGLSPPNMHDSSSKRPSDIHHHHRDIKQRTHHGAGSHHGGLHLRQHKHTQHDVQHDMTT